MAAWTKVPKENEELLERALVAYPEAEKKAMFGCPVWLINGHMFVGAHQDNIILRLSDADQDEIFKHEGVEQFSHMPGRVMKAFVSVPASIYENTAEFTKWLERARDFVLSMPPKVRKARKSK
jgi:TfoX/Sxy family transcriptional regulator of competence genes